MDVDGYTCDQHSVRDFPSVWSPISFTPNYRRADIYGLLRFGRFRPWNDWNDFNLHVVTP